MYTTDRAVRVEVQISARAMAVTQALTGPEQLKKWWGIDRALVDERADGPWALSWRASNVDPGSSAMCGTIRSLRHSSHLHIQRIVFLGHGRDLLGPLSLSFEARERGTSTVLTVCHEGFGTSADWEWYRGQVVESWPRDLASLKACLEGTL